MTTEVRRNAFWALALALGVAGTQMASFGTEYPPWTDPDEPVFILIAAHVLDGGLPNVGLIDIKPPLFFYMLAGAFAVFGETLGVAKLFGDLAVFALCAATFGVARRWTDPAPAGLGALLIVGATAGYSGQPTTTDLPAMAFLMASLWALLAGRRNPWVAGCAGLLASAAVLVRLNLCFPAAAMGAWLAFCTWRQPRPRAGSDSRRGAPATRWTPLLAFSAAAMALPALFVFLYWRAGALSDLRFFTIDMSLSYLSQGNALGIAQDLAYFVMDAMIHRPVFTAVFVAGMAAGGFSSLQQLRRRSATPTLPRSAAHEATAPDRNDDLLLAVTAGACCIAILNGGVFYPHYVYMGVPLGAVYAARGVQQALAPTGRWPDPWPARASRIVAASAFAATAGLLATALHQRATRPPPLQPVRLAAEAIATDRRPGDGVWPIDSPIASWYLDADSPLPLIFPPNVGKPVVLRPLVESGRLPARPLQAAMESAPVYLVAQSRNGRPFRAPRYFRRYDAEAAERLDHWVRDNYSLFYDAGGIAVYKAKARS